MSPQQTPSTAAEVGEPTVKEGDLGGAPRTDAVVLADLVSRINSK